MPLENFLPGAAAKVDPSKNYLITGKTLKDLLVKVRCNPSQFDVQETEFERMYTYRPSQEGGWSGDYVIFSCPETAVDYDLPMAEWPLRLIMRLTINAGRIIGVNESFTARPESDNVEYQFVQDCHFIDDPPGDDWRL